MSRNLRSSMIVACLLATGSFASRGEMNLHEWSAVAPGVIRAESLGADGRYVEFEVKQIFRGDFHEGELIYVDVRRANRTRDRSVDRKALILDPGDRVLLLLEAAPAARKGGKPVFRLVRGVGGVRELPAEGAEPVLRALERFIEMQDGKSENAKWSQLEAMLEETDPILVRTALEQFLKFRRGDPETLLTLRPLLDHPSPVIREDCARLIGRIVLSHRDAPVPEEGALRAELIGRARRDESVAVRVAAAEALEGFGGEGVDQALERVAAEDPEQAVRYAAELTMLRRQESGRAPGAAPTAERSEGGVD